MEYSVETYLRRVPTEKLEEFLENYREGKLKEDFSPVIDKVIGELARRKNM